MCERGVGSWPIWHTVQSIHVYQAQRVLQFLKIYRMITLKTNVSFIFMIPYKYFIVLHLQSNCINRQIKHASTIQHMNLQIKHLSAIQHLNLQNIQWRVKKCLYALRNPTLLEMASNSPVELNKVPFISVVRFMTALRGLQLDL